MSSKSAIRANYFLNVFAIGCTIPFLPPYFKETFGMNNERLGLLIMMRPAMALAAQPFWSLVADRTTSRTRLAAMLAVAAALLFPLIRLGRNDWTVFGLVALSAFFFTPLNSINDTIAFDFLGNQRRNFFGNLRIFASLGFFVAVIVSGALYDRFGMVLLFPIFSLGMLASAFTLRHIRTRHHPSSMFEHRKALVDFLKKRNVRFFLSAMLVCETANQMAYAFLSVYAKHLGANNAQTGWIWAVGTGAEMTTMLFMVKILRRGGIKKILFLGTFFTLFRWVPFAFLHAWWQMLPFQLIHLVTLTFSYVGAAIFMDIESSPSIRFAAQAFYSSFVLNGAAILGSVLGGVISSRLGYPALFLTSGALGVISSILVLLCVQDPAQHLHGKDRGVKPLVSSGAEGF